MHGVEYDRPAELGPVYARRHRHHGRAPAANSSAADQDPGQYVLPCQDRSSYVSWLESGQFDPAIPGASASTYELDSLAVFCEMESSGHCGGYGLTDRLVKDYDNLAAITDARLDMGGLGELGQAYEAGGADDPGLGALENVTSAADLTDIQATEGGGASGPAAGQTLYRIYGGDSRAGGASWSPVDPRTVPDYRDAAGLPSGGESGATNTGQFAIEGTLNDPSAVVLQRSALPLDGTKGGIPEYIIPDWMENGSISIRGVYGVNPGF